MNQTDGAKIKQDNTRDKCNRSKESGGTEEWKVETVKAV